MEREAEYEKLVRTGSYYDELLRMGHVVARVADTKAWRDEIKAKARADKIKVRTGLSNQDERVAWAYLRHLDDKVRSNDYDPRLADHLDAVQEAFWARAAARPHRQPRDPRRGHPRRGRMPGLRRPPLVDWTTMPPFMEGEVFDTDCCVVDYD